MAVGIFDMADRWIRASPWHLLGVVCIIGFLAGGLLDLDHIPYTFGINIGYIPFKFGKAIQEGRNLHGLALAGGGALCACAGGYLYWMVLTDAIAMIVERLNRIASRIVKRIYQLYSKE